MKKGRNGWGRQPCDDRVESDETKGKSLSEDPIKNETQRMLMIHLREAIARIGA